MNWWIWVRYVYLNVRDIRIIKNVNGCFVYTIIIGWECDSPTPSWHAKVKKTTIFVAKLYDIYYTWWYVPMITLLTNNTLQYSTLSLQSLFTSRPRQNLGRHSSDEILTYNFSWILLYFVSNLLSGVLLPICHHWLILLFGTERATGHYLNQWWPGSLTHCHS